MCHRISDMPKKKTELNIAIVKVLGVREGNCGKSFKIKVAHHKSTWVPEQKLSTGVADAYLNKLPVPKGAWARMPRHYKDKPKRGNTLLRMFQQTTEETPDLDGADEDEDAPVKKKKKNTQTQGTPQKIEGWCGLSRAYIKEFNRLVDVDTSKLSSAIDKAKSNLEPPKTLEKLFDTDKFLTRGIIKHEAKNVQCLTSCSEHGKFRCSVCKQVFNATRSDRVVMHCFSSDHIFNLIRLQNEKEHDQLRGDMNDFTSRGCTEKEITKRIQLYMAQQVASHSLPFTAGVVMADCVCASVSTVVGDADLSPKALKKMNNKFPTQTAVLRRLVNLGATQTVGKKSTLKMRVQMSAPTVRRRIWDLAQSTLDVKAHFLRHAPYVSCVIDEGNNWSKHCPLYAAAVACTTEFEFKAMFIGQEDCTGKKNAAKIYELTKKIFIDAGMEHVWLKIVSGCTDGASVMRSVRKYAGLDARGTEGESFVAYLKKDLKENAEMWHCLCHILDLGANDALNAIEAIKLYYLPHVRMMHSEFSRSSCRRADLEEASRRFKELHGLASWKIFYPMLYCPTRWLGLQRCAETLAKNRCTFDQYADMLRERGFGPRKFDPYKYRKKKTNAQVNYYLSQLYFLFIISYPPTHSLRTMIQTPQQSRPTHLRVMMKEMRAMMRRSTPEEVRVMMRSAKGRTRSTTFNALYNKTMSILSM